MTSSEEQNELLAEASALHEPACCCDRGRDIDGPDEGCPWHGNPRIFYLEAERLKGMLSDTEERAADAIDRLMTGVRELAEENAGLRAKIDAVKALINTYGKHSGTVSVYAVRNAIGDVMRSE